MKNQSKTAVKEHAGNMGERVVSIRKVLRISQKEMAAKLEIAPSYLSMVERARNKPSLDFILKLAVNYNVNLQYLLLGEGEPLKAANREEIDFTPGDEINSIGKIEWVAERSPYYKFTILAYANDFFREHAASIKQDIANWQENQKKQ